MTKVGLVLGAGPHGVQELERMSPFGKLEKSPVASRYRRRNGASRSAARRVVGSESAESLHDARRDLEQRVADQTKWLTLLHEVTRAINEAPGWDDALRSVLRRICETEQWQAGVVYLPDRDDPDVIIPVISYVSDRRFRPFQLAAERQRYRRGQTLPARVYADGTSLWLNGSEALTASLPMRGETARQVGFTAAVALPVRFGRDVIAVLELFSDQTHPPNDVLENLMNDVSIQIGRVLERERASAQLADLIWREQQSLLGTLHDSLGQTLTGLGMLASGLSQRLATADAAAAGTAKEIARQAQLALEEVRQLARNLFPLEIEAQSLMAAFKQLASTAELMHKISVRVEGAIPKALRDGAVATQLYRIVQEALTNVVKHAHARTVRIAIEDDGRVTTVRIADDGVGIQNTDHKHDGVGLGIMKYRAKSIGGVLVVEPGEVGTVVTCTLHGVPHLSAPFKG